MAYLIWRWSTSVHDSVSASDSLKGPKDESEKVATVSFLTSILMCDEEPGGTSWQAGVLISQRI